LKAVNATNWAKRKRVLDMLDSPEYTRKIRNWSGNRRE
jgi:hypothetical protein